MDIGALDVAVLAGYPGTIAVNVAASRPRRPPRESICSGDGCQQRAARSVHHPQSVVASSTPRPSVRSSIRTISAYSRGSHQVRALSSSRSAPSSGSESTTCRKFSAFWRSRGWSIGCRHRPGHQPQIRSQAMRSRRHPMARLRETAKTMRSGPGRANRTQRMPSACARFHPTTSSWWTPRAKPGLLEKLISRVAQRRCTRRRSTSIEGRLYQVDRLDFEGRKAFVREVDCDYYTDAITYTRVTILDAFEETSFAPRAHGEVHVVSRVVRFQEDQVLYERERRVGRAGSSRTADAHNRRIG